MINTNFNNDLSIEQQVFLIASKQEINEEEVLVLRNLISQNPNIMYTVYKDYPIFIHSLMRDNVKAVEIFVDNGLGNNIEQLKENYFNDIICCAMEYGAHGEHKVVEMLIDRGFVCPGAMYFLERTPERIVKKVIDNPGFVIGKKLGHEIGKKYLNECKKQSLDSLKIKDLNSINKNFENYCKAFGENIAFNDYLVFCDIDRDELENIIKEQQQVFLIANKQEINEEEVLVLENLISQNPNVMYTVYKDHPIFIHSLMRDNVKAVEIFVDNGLGNNIEQLKENYFNDIICCAMEYGAHGEHKVVEMLIDRGFVCPGAMYFLERTPERIVKKVIDNPGFVIGKKLGHETEKKYLNECKKQSLDSLKIKDLNSINKNFENYCKAFGENIAFNDYLVFCDIDRDELENIIKEQQQVFLIANKQEINEEEVLVLENLISQNPNVMYTVYKDHPIFIHSLLQDNVKAVEIFVDNGLGNNIEQLKENYFNDIICCAMEYGAHGEHKVVEMLIDRGFVCPEIMYFLERTPERIVKKVIDNPGFVIGKKLGHETEKKYLNECKKQSLDSIKIKDLKSIKKNFENYCKAFGENITFNDYLVSYDIDRDELKNIIKNYNQVKLIKDVASGKFPLLSLKFGNIQQEAEKLTIENPSYIGYLFSKKSYFDIFGNKLDNQGDLVVKEYSATGFLKEVNTSIIGNIHEYYNEDYIAPAE